jgi:hypothetical protein
MQCKDIPTEPILRFVAEHGGIGCNWFETPWSDGTPNKRSVRHAMPADTPEKLYLAKMQQLIGKGLVDGCPCGCRGDYELTDKGRARLSPTGDRSE